MSEIKKPFLRSAAWPFLMAMLLAVSFVTAFYATKGANIGYFNTDYARLPSVRLFGNGSGLQVLTYASTYGAALGLVFGALQLVIGYLFFGLLALVKVTKKSFGTMLVCLLSVLPLTALGYVLAYQSEKYTAISIAAVLFAGRPLWYAGLAVLSVSSLLFILSFKYGQDKITV